MTWCDEGRQNWSLQPGVAFFIPKSLILGRFEEMPDWTGLSRTPWILRDIDGEALLMKGKVLHCTAPWILESECFPW